MQCPDMQQHETEDYERQQVVQGVEPVQRRVADSKTAPDPLGNGRSHAWNDRVERCEQVGNDRHRPEAHLTPDQRVAHEGSGHHRQEDEHAEYPYDLARRLVGAVIHAAQNVDIHGEEEHRPAIGVHVTQQPAPVHVAHDVLDAVERHRFVRHIVHRQDDAGDHLHDEEECQDAAEGPEVVQIARHRENAELVMHQPQYRQPVVEPFR